MSDYSSVGPPQSQNFSQSSAFAAALQRAKQVMLEKVFWSKRESKHRHRYNDDD